MYSSPILKVIFGALLQVSLWALLACIKMHQYGNISWACLLRCYYGLVIGLFNKKYDVTTGKFSLIGMIWFNLAQALALPYCLWYHLPLLVIDSNLHKPGHTACTKNFVAVCAAC